MAAHDVDLDVRVIAIRTVGEFLSTLTEAESQAFPELHQVMNRLQRHEHWAVRGMANRYKHSQATSTEGAGAGIGEEDAILEDAFSLDEIPESIDSQGKPRRLNLSQVKDRKALQAATHNRQVHISTKPARLWSPVAHARAGMMARNIIR